MPITDDEKKAFRIWHIEYYSKYFDVDTTEVGARIIRSLVPFSYKFMDSVAQNPDLYALSCLRLNRVSCASLIANVVLPGGVRSGSRRR
jgi:hypothetical protein